MQRSMGVGIGLAVAALVAGFGIWNQWDRHSLGARTESGSTAAQDQDPAAMRAATIDPFALANPKAAPSFSLPDESGKTWALESARGSAVMIHFWGTWCPPCIDELPEWLALTKDLKDRKIRFVSVSLDKSWADANRLFGPGPELAHVTSLLDPDVTVPEKFGSFQYPETYLLDAQLRIVSKWVGPQDWKSEAIRNRILKVAGG